MNPPPRKMILVVDGDPEVPRQVAAWLKGEGIQVIAASDGDSGFMRLKKELPHAAIIAAQLDKVVGSVLCQRIKKKPSTSDVLVLLASEQYARHPELGRRAVSMFGADGFLAKPLEREALIESLKPVLKDVGEGVSLPAQPVEDASPETSPKPAIEKLPEPPTSEEGLRKPPVHQGNLQTTPLPKLFINLFDLNRTGVLTLERNRIRREFYFRDGISVHATSTLRTENPALMLVRDEIISEEEYSESLVLMTEQGMGMNEAIVASTTLTFEALYEHVRDYECEIMVNSFAWHEGHFEFRPEKKLADDVPSFDYSPLKIIRAGSRKHYPLKLLSKPVHEHKEEYAARTARFAELVDQLDLDPADLKFALLINGQTKVSELVTLGRDDLYGTYHLMWILLVSRMIEFSGIPKEAAECEYLDKSAKADVKLEQLPQDTLTAIMREYYRLKSSNYFRALGVDVNADIAEIEDAYQNIESRFHPDSLSQYDLKTVQGKINEILEKARAARRVLMDPRTRREYRHYLEVQERRQARDQVLQAEIAFKEGEKALKNSQFDDAKQRFEQAIEMQPDEPDYYAYLGWTMFMDAQSQQNKKDKAKYKASIKSAKQQLNKAIAMNPHSDKPYLILGRLYASEGNIESALELFEKALKVNPECAPAKAALDLIRKGADKSATSASADPQAGP